MARVRVGGWPSKKTLRGVALGLYGALCIAFALPGGSRLLSRAVWRSDHNQTQFHQWSDTLSHLGVELAPSELERGLWDFTRRYMAVRARLLAPLDWLPVHLGFGQSWRMFSSPQTTPSQLRVEVRADGDFEPIFVSRSSTLSWRAAFFEHHRVRKLLGRVGRGGKDAAFAALSKWVARRAFADFPEARVVRVRTYTWVTPSPSAEPGEGQGLQRGGKFTHESIFERAEFERDTR